MPFQLIRGDLLESRTEAIVNAANEELRCFTRKPGEGGVCGAVYLAAGWDEMAAACRVVSPCPTGGAVATPAFRLPYRCVIHAVGPVWEGGGHREAELLASAYQAALRLCRQMEIQSVAFPLISSGIFGYPAGEALRVATRAILRFLSEEDTGGSLLVQLVLRDDTMASSEALRARVLRGNELASLRVEDSLRRLEMNAPRPAEAPPAEAFAAGICEDMGAPAMASPAPELKPGMKAGRKRARKADASFLCQIRSSARNAVRGEETFADSLLRLIDETGESDAAVYKRANIDRRVFSKIRSDRMYRPSKGTALAFCLALELKPAEAERLLARAGLAFSSADLRDEVVRRCLALGVFDVFDVNEILFDLDLQGLGA